MDSAKAAETLFYDNARPDVRQHLQGHFERALDVGCDVGTLAAQLKKDGLVKFMEGVELSAAASEAEKILDRVHRVDLSHSEAGLDKESYDLVLCLDVLEHMQDPWAALARIRRLLKPSGQVVVSLPNVRNFRVVLPLLLRGRWDYARTGLLDITHIRFFTRATAIEMLEQAGFSVKREVSLSLIPYSKTWWLNLATFGLFKGLLEFQYLFFAEPKAAHNARAGNA